jgi:hypothetical protein
MNGNHFNQNRYRGVGNNAQRIKGIGRGRALAITMLLLLSTFFLFMVHKPSVVEAETVEPVIKSEISTPSSEEKPAIDDLLSITPSDDVKDAKVEQPAPHVESKPNNTITSRVYLDIRIGDAAVERIVIGLFGAALPLTTENFRLLATGERGFGFKDSKFHRIINNFMVCSSLIYG